MTRLKYTKDYTEKVKRAVSEGYPSVSSDIQVKTYLENSYNTYNIDDLMRMVRLLVVTCRLFKAHDRVYELVSTYKGSDSLFYNRIRQLWKSHSSDTGDKQSIGKHIGSLLRQYYIKRSNIQYLDYATGNGKKARDVAAMLGLAKYYGADIQDNWFGVNKSSGHHLFLPINKVQGVDLADDTLDIITCIHALHHIKEVRSVIREFKRLLRKDGIVVLVEHDCITPNDRILVDIEHALYERVFQENHSEFTRKYFGRYFSRAEMDSLLNHEGFILSHFELLRLDPCKDYSTATRSFISIYQKK